MGVIVYETSVAGNKDIKTKQQRIRLILGGKKDIEVEYIDISSSEASKEEMREKCGDPNALPPQICNGAQYCGDFDAFDLAIEDGELDKFLKL